MRKLGLGLIICAVISYSSTAWTQTCSCAGPPLLSTVEFHSTPQGAWQLGLTHEFNSQSSLVTGKETVEDDTRARSTRTLLVEASYGLTKRFSATSIFSLVQKKRTVAVSIVGQDKLITRGLGDAIFLLKYDVIPYNVFQGRQLTVGAGVKVPLGSSNLDDNGIRIATDMQPSTGSWDNILWGNFTIRTGSTSPTSLNLNASYNITGENDFGYQFGNDLTTTIGFNYDASDKAFLNGAVRYRKTSADKQNDEFEVPNTGGSWLFLIAGFGSQYKEHFTWRLSAQVPLSKNLEGTQLSTSYIYSMSVIYAWGRN